MTDPARRAPVLLAVDDSAENLKLLASILGEEGYRVRAARTGKEALASMRAEPPDLVLLDIGLPDLDGYEVCERMKSEPALADVPVVFLSGHDRVPDLLRGFRSGGVDYVVKPFEAEVVCARVRTHLTIARLRGDLVERGRRLEENNRRLEREIRERERAEASVDRLQKLLREVHHRLKNNMTALASMLSVQAQREADPRLSASLVETRSRIHTMLKLYEMLYMGDEFEKVRVGPYLRGLLADLASIYPDVSGVSVSVEVEDAPLSARLVTPLGVVVNELVTNAYKYAFAGRASGRLSVTLRFADGGGTLVVEDDGPGLPAGLDPSEERHFGLFLVQGLAGQIRGAFRLERGPGTRATVTFPV